MNYKRIVLAAMAVVAVVSFVDPVAAQSTLQAATAFSFSDVFEFIGNNGEALAQIADALADILG